MSVCQGTIAELTPSAEIGGFFVRLHGSPSGLEISNWNPPGTYALAWGDPGAREIYADLRVARVNQEIVHIDGQGVATLGTAEKISAVRLT